MARRGKLDPVIGRDDEIRRCIQILCRRTKNNPVIIGEPGVGKLQLLRVGFSVQTYFLKLSILVPDALLDLFFSFAYIFGVCSQHAS